MRNSFLHFCKGFCLILMSLLFASVCYSQEKMNLTGRAAIGARVSYVNYSDDSYNLFGVDIETELDNATMFGLNFSAFPSEYFSIEFSADYVESDLTLSALGLSAESGTLEQIPLMLVGRFNIPMKVALPYFGGGIAYFINEFDQENDVIEFIYGEGAKVSVDNSFGFLLNAGFDIFITQNFALNFDAKYVWNKLDGEVNIAGFDKEDFDFNMMIIGGGIKYYF